MNMKTLSTKGHLAASKDGTIVEIEVGTNGGFVLLSVHRAEDIDMGAEGTALRLFGADGHSLAVAHGAIATDIKGQMRNKDKGIDLRHQLTKMAIEDDDNTVWL